MGAPSGRCLAPPPPALGCIAFAASKPETAELLSRMAGDMTVHMEQRSYRGDRFDLVLNKQYVSQQQVQRRLITPDEAMRLPDEDARIFVAGHPPIRATKIRYYEDQILGKRARVPPPIAADPFKSDAGAWPSLPADEDQEPCPKSPSASLWS